MILNLHPCHVIGAQASDAIDAIDENTIVINGVAYQADPSLVTVDPSGPILGGARDAATGLLTLKVHYQYASADAAVWETPPYRGTTPEEWTPSGNPMPETVVQLTGQTAAQVTAAQVAAQIADLKGQLAALDVTIPRALEDLYTATGQTPYPTVAAVIAQKAELRAQIKALS